MRISAVFVLVLTCGILMLPTESFAVERYAYLFWGPENSMVRVPLPGTPPSEPLPLRVTPFDDVDWMATGSTSVGAGSFFSLELGSNHLVEYSPLSLSHAVVATLDLSLGSHDDLAHGPNDELVLSHGNWLYDVDTESGSVSLRASLPNEIWTFEFHQGAFYAGSGGSFVRIDPQTHEVSVISSSPVAFYWWGLSSIGGNLWCGYTTPGLGGPDQSWIGTIDPATGTRTPYIVLDNDMWEDGWVALEVFEEQTPAVPAVRPFGVAVIVIILGVAGVLALRRV